MYVPLASSWVCICTRRQACRRRGRVPTAPSDDAQQRRAATGRAPWTGSRTPPTAQEQGWSSADTAMAHGSRLGQPGPPSEVMLVESGEEHPGPCNERADDAQPSASGRTTPMSPPASGVPHTQLSLLAFATTPPGSLNLLWVSADAQTLSAMRTDRGRGYWEHDASWTTPARTVRYDGSVRATQSPGDASATARRRLRSMRARPGPSPRGPCRCRSRA